MSSSSGGGMPRLGPAWRSSASGASRGFQPPPAVPDERAASRDRSGSHASSGSGGEKGDKNRNPFGVLLDDEDDKGGGGGGGGGGGHPPGSSGGSGSGLSGSSSGGGGRFSALRSENHAPGSAIGTHIASHNPPSSSASRPFHRASSTGSGPPKRGGRSLADLAAGLSSSGNERADPRLRHQHDNTRGGHHDRGGGAGGHHHERDDPRTTSRSSSAGIARVRSGSGDANLGVGGYGGSGGGGGSVDEGKKAIRYTREKLLSLRGRGDDPPPECIVALEAEGSVVISKAAQDPVCWDTFDAEEIWASAARDRRGSGPPVADHRGDPRKGGGHSSAGRMRDFDSGDEGELRPRGSIGASRSVGTPTERFGSGGGFGERAPLGDRGPAREGFGAGRWQRGVALPEGDIRPSSRGRDGHVGGPDRGPVRSNDEDYEVSDPDDLWDDPTAGLTGGGTGAATDFSAFGGSLDDEPSQPKGKTGMNAFDLNDMSKAAAQFENELHGGDGRKMSDVNGDNGEDALENGDYVAHNVDPSRPLASTGTTIRSGSGDHVTVFEDFGDESGGEEVAAIVAGEIGKEEEEEEDLPIKSGKEENNASSRLMKMIGVAGTGEAASGTGDPSPAPDEARLEESRPEDEAKPRADSTASVPSNPWGAPASSVSSNPWGEPAASGGIALDSFAGSREAQAAKDAEAAALRQRQEQEELLRQQQQQQQQLQLQQQQAEEEEKKRWAAMQAKQQAEMQAAAVAQQEAQQAALQRQQEQLKAQQNQVELVLIERISNILENSWGRSDLNSILSTLHANDSRVIAILSTVEALRALVARHPQRIQLGRDPTMGAEMAALRLTNSQWQAHQAQVAAQQQAQAQAKMAQEQELQRRRVLQEEQARREAAAQREQQEAVARAQQQAAAQREAEERKKREAARAQQQQQQPPVVADAPWYYADPQGNIQGPFSGDEMRQWLEAGYFKGDLPISQSPGGPFRTLGSWFPDAATAFQPPGPSEEEKALEEARARVEAEARERARAEAEAQARAQAEAAAQREREAAEEAARQAEERARVEAEERARAEKKARAKAAEKAARAAAAQREKAAAERNEQSAQLKMMLGLGAAMGGSGGGDGLVIGGLSAPEPVAAEQPPAPQPAPAPTKRGKKKKQQQQQPQSEPPVVHLPPAPVAAPEPAHAAPVAWGGAVAAKVTRKKSMSEIQQEEAREATRRAREQGISLATLGGSRGGGGGGGGGTGGWANVAASGGSTAWGGAAVVKVTPAAVVTPTPVVAGPPAQRGAAQAAWSGRPAPPAASKKGALKAVGLSVIKPPKNAGASAGDDFGMNGRMSPTLESWCKEQMRHLNGSDDLTLVSFCMTLQDGDEIRQYLTAYLGHSPRVTAFATEFIRRKGPGENGRGEGSWESAGGPKGKRGKKKGGK